MAEYSTSTSALGNALSSQLGSDVSHEILALLNSTQASQSTEVAANIVTDYSGGGVPAGTDIVYISPDYAASTAGQLNIGNELADVTAIVLPGTGSATVVLNGGVDRVITVGGGGDTVKITGETNDTISNVGDRSLIDAGAGFDKVVLAGNLSDYEPQVTDKGLLLVNHHGDAIEIQHAEFVQFADGSVIINAQSADDANVAKLYNIILDRVADASGTKYWWDPGDTKSVVDVADAFLHSEEFTKAHGNVEALTSGEFLDIMYLNTFGRAADAAGKAYWQSVLDSGVTKAEIALYFAQSKEESALTVAKINVIQDILT